MNALDDSIVNLFHSASEVMVISHIRADGDAIGSVLGLGLALEAAGKRVQMILPEGVPQSFRYLPACDRVVKRPTAGYDTVVVLDCSDLQRTGGVLDGRTPDINIDHHVTNLQFAKVNLVEPQAAATSAILAEKLMLWGLDIPQNAAEALLTGIIADSLGFRTSNVTPKTLRTAASLMELGANLSRLYNQALIQRSYEAALFWGKGLAQLQREERLVYSTLTAADRSASRYPGNDDADLINLLSSIDEFDIALIFVEHTNGRIKVSWRARPGWNVAKIALQFGGGGHAAAAGAEIPGKLEEVRERVLTATRAYLQQAS